ncbi:MAG: heavy metal-responsive transcriptional regulator [Acidobacteriota bacterium]|nr:heavy metal-responsive transcriptional regulator [Acidobacteriota bacterium]
MRIGELAARAGVGVQTIRFYERRRLLPKARRLASGYRDYPAETAEVVRFIKRFQGSGFTLREIEGLLGLMSTRKISAAEVRARVEAKIRLIDEQIGSLQAMRDRLSASLAACDCRDGRTLCPGVRAAAAALEKS